MYFTNIYYTCFSISDYKWTDLLEPVYVNEFTEPAVTVPSSPLKVFQQFFTSALMHYIVTETNWNASFCMGDEKYQKLKKITVEDMNAYFGVMITMGLIKLPALSDYWRRDPLFHCSIIADCMTRDRFFDIHRYLHFVDNSSTSTPSTDRLHKIRPFLTMIGERYEALYQPHCQCAIDEAMVPYKGRSTLK